jgi:alanine dehydrogenase
LAGGGLEAIREHPGLRAGLSVHRGKLVSEPVAESLSLAYQPVAEALAA